MSLTGIVCLAFGLYSQRRELLAAHGLERLVSASCILISFSLAMFAPEHFQGPEFVQGMVPPWMPVHAFWVYLVGSSLLAAACSFALGKCLRLSSTLLGLMFVLFVAMIYLPSALRHPGSRLAWAYMLRDLSFGAGAWAMAALQWRESAPRISGWTVTFSRAVFSTAAVFYSVQHFLHPGFAPGVPLEKEMPAWVPFRFVWAYLTGAVLLVSGAGLALNRRPRIAAASIGALMVVLSVFPYFLFLIAAHGDQGEVNEALNYIADTLLYGGSALALASALPRETKSASPR